MKDYYEILEVHPKASYEVIKKAYQALAMKYHPDTTKLDKNMANKKMAEINEAFRILSNKNSRVNYDSQFTQSRSNNDIPNNNDTPNSNGLSSSPEAIYIVTLSEETMSYLKKNIVHDNKCIDKNKQHCDSISKKFEQGISIPLSELNGKYTDKDDLHNIIGLVYWDLACSYTWAQDAESVKKFLNLSYRYINPKYPAYDKYIKNYLRVKGNIEHVSNPTHNKQSKPIIIIQHILRHFRLYAAAVVILFIIFDNNNTSNTNNAKTKSSISQAQPQTHQTKNKETAIPKSNVKTQYSKDEPMLNNDGLCEITIDNSKNDMPVYVRIWDMSSQSPIRAFTINKSEKFTAKNITPGKYEIRYKELYENDVPSFGAKSEPVNLEQTELDNGTQYSKISFTLYKVKNGNARVSQIPVDDI